LNICILLFFCLSFLNCNSLKYNFILSNSSLLFKDRISNLLNPKEEKMLEARTLDAFHSNRLSISIFIKKLPVFLSNSFNSSNVSFNKNQLNFSSKLYKDQKRSTIIEYFSLTMILHINISNIYKVYISDNNLSCHDVLNVLDSSIIILLLAKIFALS
jgi:hypothetical protein